MSVSEKQTVEIVKVLYRGADILILDEPTAVLTPQETRKLFAVLRRMRDDGKAILIITHKLHEVLALSDRVAVLRKGEFAGEVETGKATESSLTEMMVGKKIALNIARSEPVRPQDRLVVKGLNCTTARASSSWTTSASPRARARSWASRALRAAASASCWRPSPACRRSTRA